MRKKNHIVCNSCGKAVEIKDGLLKEEFCEIIKEWGYFSKKDMEVHKFNLCEECYDKMVTGLAIPVEAEEVKEML